MLTETDGFLSRDFTLAIMRHDIDRKLENALFTARIEAESGIKGGMSISSYKIYNHDHIDG